MTSPEELPKLIEFRSRIHSIYPESDQKMLAWLRARDLNVDKAEQMLRRNLIWRRNNEIPSLLSWASPKCFFPYLRAGCDLDDYPVFLLPIGRWEFRGVVEAGDMVPSLKYIYQFLENMISCASKNDRHQGILICDFDGFGYRQLAHRTVVQGMTEVLRVFEANYPESLKAAFVINAPKVFYVLFNLLKPLLNSRTLAKIQIFGPDREKWQNSLFKNIGRNQIPPHWGGTLAGKDEYCSNLWHGEPLQHFFMRKLSASNDENGEEWFTVKIKPREQFALDYEVNGNGNGSEYILKWSFTTDGYDIGFSIIHTDSEENIVPFQRVESHLKRVDGAIKLLQSGKYQMVFDNSYSRSRAKTLHCSIALIEENYEDFLSKMSSNSSPSSSKESDSDEAEGELIFKKYDEEDF